MLAALSVHEYLEQKLGATVSIKWPNDIYVAGNKIAGILIENNVNANAVTSSIIGIGLNVNQTTFPEGLKATSMFLETGQMQDRAGAVRGISELLIKKSAANLDFLDSFSALKSLYLEKLLFLNINVRVFDNRRAQFTTIQPLDIAKSGQLIAKNTEGELAFYDVKDLVWY